MAVRHADQRAIERADARRAQSDVLDRADYFFHLEENPDPHRLVENQRGTGDDVFERLLRRQRDGDPANTEAGECRVGSTPK